MPYRPIVARITVENLEDGTSTVQELPAGDYLLVVTAPCRLDGSWSKDGRRVILELRDRVPTPERGEG